MQSDALWKVTRLYVLTRWLKGSYFLTSSPAFGITSLSNLIIALICTHLNSRQNAHFIMDSQFISSPMNYLFIDFANFPGVCFAHSLHILDQGQQTFSVKG